MALSQQRLSDLIGSIYDCAIDPARWPGTIEEICRELRCKCGNLMVIDYQQRHISYAAEWNFDPTIISSDTAIRWWEIMRGFLVARALDEPYAMSRFDADQMLKGMGAVYLNKQQSFAHLAKAALRLNYRKVAKVAQRYIGSQGAERTLAYVAVEQAMIADGLSPTDILISQMEWSRKTRILDTLSTIVLRDQWRIGLFNADRDYADGFGSDEDLDILRMIAPHIRRAVTIGDLLNLKMVEAHALGATLDKLVVGVIVVAANGRILHTNEAADGMLAAASPISSLQGRLHLAGAADAELAKAIKLAEREADIGKVGIAIPLPGENADVTLAHVLPLVRGEVRSQLLPHAAAAIFITRPGQASPSNLSGFAEIFRLTPAETRVLQELIRGGATMIEVASSLDISETTAKTHLSHILAKTGVGRQAELIALVRDLVPPLATR